MKIIKSLFSLLRIIFFDERGFDPITAGLMIAGGGSVLGGLFGKNKTSTQEPFPGYLHLAQTLTPFVDKKIEETPKGYGGSFDIPKPGIEQAAEDVILGKLKSPPSVASYSSDITDKYYAARKARLGESFDEERKKSADMYNRLGLVSSTPGLQAQQDISRTQGLQEDEISAQLMYEDIAREMEATKMVEDILSDYTSKGLGLGAAQRGYGQYTNQMQYQDWLNTQNQPFQWANLAANILGKGQATTTSTPNAASQIGQAGQDIGSLLLMSGLMK